MNLNQLYYFAASARHQHYTRAAEELFISQPSLSHAIASLEAELGTELFEKRGRNVVLTEHGKIFLAHVERALTEIDQGKSEIARLTGAEAGHISIAYPEPMATNYLTALLSEFTQHPENKGTIFSFTHEHPDALISGLKARKYDLAFLPLQQEDPEILNFPLFTERIQAVVPKSHPLAAFDEISPEALEPYPIMIYQQSVNSLDLSHHPDLPHTDKMNILCRSDDNIMLHRMVQHGLGLALTMPIPELDSMDLKALPLTDTRYSLGVGIAIVKDRHLPPVVNRFLEEIRKFHIDK